MTTQPLAYCMNVHPCRNLAQLLDNLQIHASRVRQLACPNDILGVGLWLPQSTIDDAWNQRTKLRETLEANQLKATTINAFPQGDFHATHVKHQVYQPNWQDPSRLAYTLKLAELHATLLDEGDSGTLSTVPLGWRGQVDQTQCAFALRQLTQSLDDLYQRSGRQLRIAIEPEPGCELDTLDDLTAFYHNHLMGHGIDDIVQRHIGLCYDICHGAIMHENPAKVVTHCLQHALPLYKVQVSSAPQIDFCTLSELSRENVVQSLQQWTEPRYLHQTSVLIDNKLTLYEDLPAALKHAPRNGTWRIHFHLPIHLSQVGTLDTTQNNITDFMPSLKQLPPTQLPDVEIETYAWHVLPENSRCTSLEEDIAHEITWLHSIITP